MAIPVTVTLYDIVMGDPYNAVGCPVALALNRTLGGRWNVKRLSATRRDDTEGLQRIELPETASKFIRDFDHLRPVYPFTFEVTTNELRLREGR